MSERGASGSRASSSRTPCTGSAGSARPTTNARVVGAPAWVVVRGDTERLLCLSHAPQGTARKPCGRTRTRLAHVRTSIPGQRAAPRWRGWAASAGSVRQRRMRRLIAVGPTGHHATGTARPPRRLVQYGCNSPRSLATSRRSASRGRDRYSAVTLAVPQPFLSRF